MATLFEPFSSFFDLRCDPTKPIDIKILPPENIFFISISDWDWIVQALKDDIILYLGDLLKKAKDCNGSTDPQEQVFMMEQVLRKYYKVQQFDLSYHRKVHGLIDVLTKDSDPKTSHNEM